MKFIPLAGLLLAVWGLLTLDWIKVVFGLLMFLCAFAVDLFKKRKVIWSDKVFPVHKALTDSVRIVRQAFDHASSDTTSPKAKLALGLFVTGMIDVISRSADLDDSEFLELHKSSIDDLGFGSDFSRKILAFHQSAQVKHRAFAAIRQGAEFFTKAIDGNPAALLVCGSTIEEFVKDPAFPKSIDHL